MEQQAIGQKIRTLRRKLGYDTFTLADEVGMTQAQVSRLERGLQGLRSNVLMKFAKVLKVPPIYFFLDDDVTCAKVEAELQEAGLEVSNKLRRALGDPAFLKFAEGMARFCSADEENLAKLKKAAKGIRAAKSRRKRGRPRKRRRRKKA